MVHTCVCKINLRVWDRGFWFATPPSQDAIQNQADQTLWWNHRIIGGVASLHRFHFHRIHRWVLQSASFSGVLVASYWFWKPMSCLKRPFVRWHKPLRSQCQKKVKVKRRQILFWRQSTPLKPNSGTWMWGDLFSQRKSHLKAITWRFFVTFLGWLSDPFKGLSDLQLGDEKGTLNHLESLSFQILRWLFSGDAGFQPLSLGNSGVDQAKMALVWVVGSSALDIGEVDRHLQKIKVIGAPWYIFYLRATPWNLAAKTPPESRPKSKKGCSSEPTIDFQVSSCSKPLQGGVYLYSWWFQPLWEKISQIGKSSPNRNEH